MSVLIARQDEQVISAKPRLTATWAAHNSHVYKGAIDTSSCSCSMSLLSFTSCCCHAQESNAGLENDDGQQTSQNRKRRKHCLLCLLARPLASTAAPNECYQERRFAKRTWGNAFGGRVVGFDGAFGWEWNTITMLVFQFTCVLRCFCS